MNDLPRQGTISDSKQTPTISISGVGSGLGKEGEGLSSAEQPIGEIHKELELPKEVVSAGVKVQPTVVNIPQPVTQIGVKQTGVNTGLGSGATVVLPLTQPQITQGLQQNILSSWRWLAVWCIRRLKQFRFLNLTNTTNPINPTNDK
jgi:hypothetical protein